MRRPIKILLGTAAAALLVVAAITAWGWYLNEQDAKSCADLYPTDWQRYEACRALVERLRTRRRLFI